MIPYFDQYLGPWAMAEDRFSAFAHHAANLDVAAHVSAVQAAGGVAGGRSYEADIRPSGVAVVELSGLMMKQESSMGNATSTVKMRGTLRALAANEGVKGVMMIVDSPGGTAAGTADLADDMAALASKKRVHVYANGAMMSAAYWVGSQAHEISAGRDAMIGSIGTYGVVYDSSGQAAMNGVKAHVIRAGEFKGMATPGTPVTPEQLGELQRNITAINEHFLAGVVSGRKLPAARVSQMADGRSHIARAAMELGMIDRVESFDDALARLEGMVSKPNIPAGRSGGAFNSTAQSGPEEESVMSETKTAPSGSQAVAEPKPATIAELKAAFPSDAAFALDAADKAYTLTEAKAAYADVLLAKLNASETELAKAKEVRPEPIQGSKPLGGASEIKNSGDGDVIYASSRAEFMDQVQRTIKGSPNMDHAAAVRAVAKNHPELHQKMLDEANSRK